MQCNVKRDKNEINEVDEEENGKEEENEKRRMGGRGYQEKKRIARGLTILERKSFRDRAFIWPPRR